jgi:tetratricopeptide (TPR) repeat protein
MVDATEHRRAAGAWDSGVPLAQQICERQPGNAPALSFLCQAAQASSDWSEAARLASEIVEHWPDIASAWLNLALLNERCGRIDEALAAHAEMLRRQPDAPLNVLRAAQSLASAGHTALAESAASAAFRMAPVLLEAYRVDEQPAHVRELSRRGNEILRDHHWQQLSDRLDSLRDELDRDVPRMREFIDGLLGRKPIDYPHPLQRPSHLYVPGLTAKPWWEREELPCVYEVEAAFDAIHREMTAVLGNDEGITPYIDRTPETPAVLEEIAGTLSWSAYHFYRHGRPIPEHMARCPDTMSVMHRMPLMTQQSHGAECFFSIVKPKSRIPAHVGHSNVKLGVHFPLVVPPDCGFKVGGEVRHWQPGECLIFDDGFVHEVWNDSDSHRVVLIFDIWHPDLDAAERRALDELTELTAAIHEARSRASVEALLERWPIQSA